MFLLNCLLLFSWDWIGSSSQDINDNEICSVLTSTPLKSSLIEPSKEIELTFENLSEDVVDIFWINYEGIEVLIDSIESKQKSLLTSFLGNAWRIKLQINGNIIFQQVLTEDKPSLEYSVGSNCKSTHRSNLNSTEYSFKTLSKVELISEPQTIETSLKASPCYSIGLSDWINKYVVSEGYHALCLSNTNSQTKSKSWSVSIEAWKDGYQPLNQNSGQSFLVSSFIDLRNHIEKLLPISTIHSDRYLHATKQEIFKRKHKSSASGQSTWEYLPQPFALFKTDRTTVRSLEDLDIFRSSFQLNSFLSSFFFPPKTSSMIVLVMEGGQFVYPGIDLGFTRTIRTNDRQIDLITLSMRPLILKIDDFLSSSEIAYIIQHSASHMKASPVSLMDKDKGKSAAEFRTSEQVFLVDDSLVLKNLELRVANLTGIPTYQQEKLQVLKYEINQYYLPHLDYWDPIYYQSPEEVKRSQAGHKNRLSTVFWYLSDCEGGQTAFPLAPIEREHISQILPDDRKENPHRFIVNKNTPEDHFKHTMGCDYGLRVSPRVGSAILFYSLLPNGMGDVYSQHAACAVKNGTKWAANKWVWNQRL